jgi:CRP/FNR family transcriptional regulator, cyclic AMP receptor protein
MNLSEWRTRATLFEDLDDECFRFLESTAEEVHVGPDRTIFRVNTPADRFFLVTEGTVALRLSGPSRPAMTVQTVRPGGMLGLSWYMPPYLWQWTAQTTEDTTLATFDAATVIARCQSSPVLEIAMLRVIAGESYKRLQNVRFQLLDVYGDDRS